jgi:hypothetical protein
LTRGVCNKDSIQRRYLTYEKQNVLDLTKYHLQTFHHKTGISNTSLCKVDCNKLSITSLKFKLCHYAQFTAADLGWPLTQLITTKTLPNEATPINGIWPYDRAAHSASGLPSDNEDGLLAIMDSNVLRNRIY